MVIWVLILTIFTVVNYSQIQSLQVHTWKALQRTEVLRKTLEEMTPAAKEVIEMKKRQVIHETMENHETAINHATAVKHESAVNHQSAANHEAIVKRESVVNHAKEEFTAQYPDYTPSKRDTAFDTKNLENLFGRNIIGVVAAVLIFIGIIAFGAIVFTAITDVMKVAVIFAGSLLLSAAGIYLVKKDSNPFTNSVLGCGFGAIFVSIFVTHLYFNLISDLVAFGGVLIWMLLVYWVAKTLQSKTLLYISHIGCAISILLTIPYRMHGLMLTEITLYQMVSLSLLVILDYLEVKTNRVLEANPSKILFKVALYSSMAFHMLWTLFLAASGRTNVLLLGGLTVGMNIGLFLVSQKQVDQNKTAENIGASLLCFCTVVLGFGTLVYQEMRGLVFQGLAELITLGILLGVIVLVYGLYSAMTKEKDENVLIVALLSGLFTIIMMAPVVNRVHITGIFLLGFSALALYLFYQNRGIKFFVLNIVSIVILSWFVVVYRYWQLVLPPYVYSIFVMVHIGYLIHLKWNDYLYFPFVYFAWINTHLLLCLTGALAKFDLSVPMPAMIVMVLNILLYAKLNTIQKEDSEVMRTSNLLTYILESIVILGYSAYIADEHYFALSKINDFGLSILAVLMFIWGCMRAAKQLESKNAWLGLWYGIKVTWLTLFPLVTLTGLLEEQIVFSVACMLVALVCIFFGFRFQIKSTRIYGLVLTLASVLKIVIADVWGQDSIIRVIALIAGGMICFAISATYNYIEKQEAAKRAPMVEEDHGEPLD